MNESPYLLVSSPSLVVLTFCEKQKFFFFSFKTLFIYRLASGPHLVVIRGHSGPKQNFLKTLVSSQGRGTLDSRLWTQKVLDLRPMAEELSRTI